MRMWIPAFVLALWAAPGAAQTLPEAPVVDLADVEYLEPGERAPWAGWLVHEEAYGFALLRIDILEHRLVADVAAAEAVCVQRLAIADAHTLAARDTGELRERLLRERGAELAAALAEAQSQRGPAWYQEPALWVVIGAVLGGVVVGALAAALE